jgi:hypothetical protein
MSVAIAKRKKAGSDAVEFNHYVRYTEEDGSESTVPLSPFGEMDQEKLATVRAVIRAGQLNPPKKRGRPRGAKGQPKVTPDGLRIATPQEAVDGCDAWLEAQVRAEDLAEDTWKGRVYQLRRMVGWFGGKSWSRWNAEFWLRLDEEYTKEKTINSYGAAAGVLARYGREQKVFIPPFKTTARRPASTPTARRRRRKRGPAKRRKSPHDLKVVRDILIASREYEHEPYMGLLVPVVGLTAMAPADAHYLLGGRFGSGEGIHWDGADLWYGAWRIKSEEGDEKAIPLASPLARLLAPHRAGDLGLDCGFSIAQNKFKGTYPRFREHFVEIERRAGAPPLRGHRFKRLRHTLQVALENTILVGEPPVPVPLPVRKRLMMQSYEGSGDAITYYGHAEDALCVEAVENYAALLDLPW